MTDFETVEAEVMEEAAMERSDIKLFGKWPLDEVQVSDISLQVCLPLSLPSPVPGGSGGGLMGRTTSR